MFINLRRLREDRIMYARRRPQVDRFGRRRDRLAPPGVTGSHRRNAGHSASAHVRAAGEMTASSNLAKRISAQAKSSTRPCAASASGSRITRRRRAPPARPGGCRSARRTDEVGRLGDARARSTSGHDHPVVGCLMSQVINAGRQGRDHRRQRHRLDGPPASGYNAGSARYRRRPELRGGWRAGGAAPETVRPPTGCCSAARVGAPARLGKTTGWIHRATLKAKGEGCSAGGIPGHGASGSCIRADGHEQTLASRPTWWFAPVEAFSAHATWHSACGAEGASQRPNLIGARRRGRRARRQARSLQGSSPAAALAGGTEQNSSRIGDFVQGASTAVSKRRLRCARTVRASALAARALPALTGRRPGQSGRHRAAAASQYAMTRDPAPGRTPVSVLGRAAITGARSPITETGLDPLAAATRCRSPPADPAAACPPPVPAEARDQPVRAARRYRRSSPLRRRASGPCRAATFRQVWSPAQAQLAPNLCVPGRPGLSNTEVVA